LEAEAVAVAEQAARLLGTDRPWRRATDNDLYVEGEYRLRAARECLALDPPSPELCAFHEGALEGIRVEIERRLATHAPRRSKGMTPADVERIRDAVPCQEYMQRFTDLRPAGRERWLGLCPFHAERTPSLSVWPTHFVCFGCGAKGDVFALVMLALDARKVNVAGLVTGGAGGEATFRDAVRVLADWAGLPDPTVPPMRAGRDHDL
jgi:hypothetical protein